MTEPQHIGTFVILLNKDKKQVLLGKRKNAYKAGWYGCPGGRVEIGEDVQTALIREIKEETALTAKKVDYIGVVKEFQGKHDFVHFVFVCSDYDGEVKCTEPDKCENWDFYPFTHLPSEVLEGHLAGIQKLYLAKKSNGLISI